jgi:hypothetical protein
MSRSTSSNWEGKSEKVGKDTFPSAESGTMILAIKADSFNLKSRNFL